MQFTNEHIGCKVRRVGGGCRVEGTLDEIHDGWYYVDGGHYVADNSTYGTWELATELALQLRVGGTYRTREGEVITIRSHWPSRTYPWKGDNGRLYTDNGHWLAGGRVSPTDLVSEVGPVPSSWPTPTPTAADPAPVAPTTSTASTPPSHTDCSYCSMANPSLDHRCKGMLHDMGYSTGYQNLDPGASTTLLDCLRQVATTLRQPLTESEARCVVVAVLAGAAERAEQRAQEAATQAMYERVAAEETRRYLASAAGTTTRD